MDIKEEEVRKKFEKYGDIESVLVKKTLRKAGPPFAFLQFTDPKDAEKAIQETDQGSHL